jgi:hypothetical protein
MPEITEAHVANYLEQVRALIGIPQDAETEHQIAAELFPGFLAAVVAALDVLDIGPGSTIFQDGYRACADHVREAISRALFTDPEVSEAVAAAYREKARREVPGV